MIGFVLSHLATGGGSAGKTNQIIITIMTVDRFCQFLLQINIHRGRERRVNRSGDEANGILVDNRK